MRIKEKLFQRAANIFRGGNPKVGLTLTAMLTILMTVELIGSSKKFLFLFPILALTMFSFLLQREERYLVIILTSGPISLYSSSYQFDLRLPLLMLSPLILLLLILKFGSPRLPNGYLMLTLCLEIVGVLISLNGGYTSSLGFCFLFAPILLILLQIGINIYGLNTILLFLLNGVFISTLLALAQFGHLIGKLPGAYDETQTLITAAAYGRNLNRLSGPVGDYELFGWTISVGLSYALGFVFSRDKRSIKLRPLLLFFAVVFIIAGILTGNRATLIEIIIILAGSLWFQNRQSLRNKIVVLVILPLITFIIYPKLDAALLLSKRSGNLQSLGLFHSLFSTRLPIWQEYTNLPGFISFTGHNLSRSSYQQFPHNLWIWVIYSTGVMGLIAFLIITAISGHRILKLLLSDSAINRSLAICWIITMIDNLICEPTRLAPTLILWMVVNLLPFLVADGKSSKVLIT